MSVSITRTKTRTKPVIELTTDHTGKMLGMQSLSTSCRKNPGCIRNSKIKGSICEHCYAQTMLKMYKDLDKKLDHNTEALTTKVLDFDDLPYINCQVFRFESFGDIHNEIHLQNYINIANKNPGCRFTLWTKNYGVALKYFTDHECPSNFTLIISSLFVNKKQDLTLFKATGKFKKGQLKVFTVYDYEYIVAHHDELNINCGSRLCMGCRICYDKNEIEEVNEILKSDQARAEEFLDKQKPDYNDRMGKVLEEVADAFDEFEDLDDSETEEDLSYKGKCSKEAQPDPVMETEEYEKVPEFKCTGICEGCPFHDQHIKGGK